MRSSCRTIIVAQPRVDARPPVRLTSGSIELNGATKEPVNLMLEPQPSSLRLRGLGRLFMCSFVAFWGWVASAQVPPPAGQKGTKPVQVPGMQPPAPEPAPGNPVV